MANTGNPVVAVGTTLGYKTSGEIYTSIGKLLRIGEFADESEEIDVTTLDTEGGYKQFIQGWKDCGSVEIEAQYIDKEVTDVVQVINNLYKDGTVADWRITYPTGSTIDFKAFIKSRKFGEANTSDVLTFSTELRVSGEPEYTPGI